MSTRTKTRTLTIILALSTALIFGGPRSAAGRCLGADRARLLHVFEVLQYWGHGSLNALEHGARSLLDRLSEPAQRLGTRLSHVLLRWESRGALHRLLAGEAFSADKLADELDQARRVLEVKSFPPELMVKWREIIAQAAGTFQVCQAVRRQSPDSCGVLEPLGKKLKPECESLAIRIGILYTSRFSDQAIRSMASAWGREIDTIRTLCRAIEKQEPATCDGIPTKSPQEKLLCRALAGDGEAACNDSSLDDKTARECRTELRIRQAAAGDIPLSDLPEELKTSLLLWPALQAARAETTCDQLAQDAFEKQAATIESIRLFQTEP